jgi:hypothetical protein
MTLELQRTAVSRNVHEPLVLVPTTRSDEHIVVVEGSPSALAVAVIRAEDSGVYCYPHGPALPRLGPFATAEAALEACREIQRSERCYDSCCQGIA